MRVLLIDGYEAGHADAVAAETATQVLRSNGHEVDVVALAAMGFGAFMSPAERAAYESDEPLIAAETKASAEALARAEALLFCYPTVMFMVPPLVKSWLERVLVPGVAFVFDNNNKVRPGMTNVKRLGVVTTTPHSAARTRQARDLGRRTIMWTLRLNCHRFCRRTYVTLPVGQVDHARIKSAFGKW